MAEAGTGSGGAGGAPLAEFLDAVRRRDPRALGRVLSIVEDGGSPAARLRSLLDREVAPAPWVLGLTGPPGAGKSTLLACLLAQWRAEGTRVGVLAVDPSSPRSGGALLGDRIRFQRFATDPDVVIRSMANRGALGGLTPAVHDAITVLALAGCAYVCVETVGVGQAEVDVAGVADTVVLTLAPGAGDDIQAAKAGVSEIADVVAVTKGDLPGADRLVRELRAAVGAGVEVVRTSAAGDAVRELTTALGAHRVHVGREPDPARGRAAAAGQIEAAVRALLGERSAAAASGRDPVAAALLDRVRQGVLDPLEAVEGLLRDRAGDVEDDR